MKKSKNEINYILAFLQTGSTSIELKKKKEKASTGPYSVNIESRSHAFHVRVRLVLYRNISHIIIETFLNISVEQNFWIFLE